MQEMSDSTGSAESHGSLCWLSEQATGGWMDGVPSDAYEYEYCVWNGNQGIITYTVPRTLSVPSITDQVVSLAALTGTPAWHRYLEGPC
jgi:hypothetical protein